MLCQQTVVPAAPLDVQLALIPHSRVRSASARSETRGVIPGDGPYLSAGQRRRRLRHRCQRPSSVYPSSERSIYARVYLITGLAPDGASTVDVHLADGSADVVPYIKTST